MTMPTRRLRCTEQSVNATPWGRVNVRPVECAGCTLKIDICQASARAPRGADAGRRLWGAGRALRLPPGGVARRRSRSSTRSKRSLASNNRPRLRDPTGWRTRASTSCPTARRAASYTDPVSTAPRVTSSTGSAGSLVISWSTAEPRRLTPARARQRSWRSAICTAKAAACTPAARVACANVATQSLSPSLEKDRNVVSPLM